MESDIVRPILRVNLRYGSIPCPILSLVRKLFRCRNRGSTNQKVANDRSAVDALRSDTKSTGRYCQVMAQSAVDKIPRGPKLDALTAEKVFGWKNVHQHEGSLVGKRQDKAGHWRLAKLLNYSTSPLHAYTIEKRMSELGRSEQYLRELSRITRAKKIPPIGLRLINVAELPSKLLENTAG
jgi:hypothetical protein